MIAARIARGWLNARGIDTTGKTDALVMETFHAMRDAETGALSAAAAGELRPDGEGMPRMTMHGQPVPAEIRAYLLGAGLVRLDPAAGTARRYALTSRGEAALTHHEPS
jgi:hypothetical protein